MDPLSIAASIVALCTACDAAYRATRTIRKTVKKIEGANNDMDKFADDIDLYAIVIGTAHTALEPYRSSDLRETRVLSYLRRFRGFKRLVKQSENVKEDIDRYMRKLCNLRGKHRLIVGYKWRFQKKEIDDMLRPAMARVTCNLQIVMSSLALEAALKQPPSPDTARRIKRLKLEIEVHLRKIASLKDQLASRIGNSTHESNGSQSASDTYTRNAFVELAESLIENDTVPGYPSMSPFPSSTRNTNTQNNDQPEHYSSGSRLHSRMSMSSRASEWTSATSLEPDIHFVKNTETDESTRHKSKKSSPTSIPPIRGLKPQRPPVASPSRVAVDVPIQPSPDETSEVDITPNLELKPTTPMLPGPPTQTQGDFIGTYSSSFLLHLNPHHTFTAETGYIYTPTGIFSATALVNNDFDGNFISQAWAVRLGLEINELEDEEDGVDESWIDFGDGQRERKIGTVKLRWGDTQIPDRKPFPVHCWVCVHDIRNLVFGRPFVEKRNHYLKRTGREGGIP